MRVALVVATKGRPTLLPRVARHWLCQNRPADRVIVSAAEFSDVADLRSAMPSIEVLTGRVGLCAQRNAALDHLRGDCGVVVFLDDDFVPTSTLVDGARGIFMKEPEIAVVTGFVIADGVNGPGIPYEEAARLVQEYEGRHPFPHITVDTLKHGYGCNMAVRLDQQPNLRFDERLPLYGWQEDLDFTRRLAGSRRIVRCNAFAGVHMGIKGGRSPGIKLGYSQVANPLYLSRKKVMSRGEALRMISRNIVKNAARSMWAENWVDRRGRLKGNLIAAADFLRRRIRPERVLEL